MPRRLLLLLAALPAAAADWPGWRGPTRDGVSPERAFPITWSAKENVRWKAAVPGLGVSAPVVCGPRVFLTSCGGRAGEELYLLCYHRDDGRLLWQRRFFGSELSDGQFAAGGMAVPTPVTDGARVYALYGTGDLVCLDLDGKPVWIRSLANEYGAFRNRWGMASSPLLLGGLLVVQVDHWTGSYLLGVNAATGKNHWRTPRGIGVNWTSPVAVRVGGRSAVIATGTKAIKGYDAATGRELWSLPGLLPQCIPTPVVQGDRFWLTSGSGFTTLCVKLEEGEKPAARVLWKAPSRGTEIPSPVLCNGLLYYAEDAGFAVCLRADTGERVWRGRLGAKVQASPVAAGDKVYFATVNGVVTVLRAGEQLKVLARNELGEGVVASPALAGSRIFLRGEKHLFCIGGE